jgi:tripartite-type tricarboxylate transporter receptor subunit TctC
MIGRRVSMTMASAAVDAWAKELKAVLILPETQEKLTELGLDVETSTPAEFTQRMTTDLARWKAIIDEIGYKPT